MHILINALALYKRLEKLKHLESLQEARKINIAQYQKIIYEEFLPSLLGQKIMDIYNLSINTKEIYTVSMSTLNTFKNAI